MLPFYGAGGEHAHATTVTYDADHPAVLVGADRGPTPVEFLLHALAACLTAGIANIAAARGVTLTEVESTLEGDIDLQGILGLSDRVFFRDPITAHGITDALRDAALLARELAGGAPDAFARYQAARDEHAIPMLELTDTIASFEWNLEELAELQRQLNRVIARELELVRSLAPEPVARASAA